MNAVKTLARVQLMTRTFSSTPKFQARDMKRFKELQRQMQVDDGVPIHLKMGVRDKLWFGFLVVGVGSCMIMSAEVLYKMVYPPPNN